MEIKIDNPSWRPDGHRVHNNGGVAYGDNWIGCVCGEFNEKKWKPLLIELQFENSPLNTILNEINVS